MGHRVHFAMRVFFSFGVAFLSVKGEKDGSDLKIHGYLEQERRLGFPNLSIHNALKKNSESLPQKRRQSFIYNHNQKTAGSFIYRTLKDKVVPSLPDGIKFIYKSEREGTGKEDWKKSFVIGSVREPCVHLVSLWAFGSRGGGGHAGHLKLMKQNGRIDEEEDKYFELYGKEKPFDGAEDVARFRKWAVHPKTQGLLTARFVHSYENRTYVDCFVRSDGEAAIELGRCLENFVRQADGISSEQVRFKISKKPHNATSGHASCSHYYDDKTARSVQLQEKPLFDAFGYPECCAPGLRELFPPRSKTHDKRNV